MTMSCCSEVAVAERQHRRHLLERKGKQGKQLVICGFSEVAVAEESHRGHLLRGVAQGEAR